MNAMDLSEFAPAKNSAIFLDEAGILFDNRNFKNFNSGLRDFSSSKESINVVSS